MTLILKVNEKDHIQGATNAPIELVEYADYECPYCRKAYYMIKEAQKALRHNLKFVFRNFPLSDMHPYALHAAVAAEVAGAQKKFWEMHDMLFENQDYLEDRYLLEYAREIDLNTKEFEEDFQKDEFYKKIENDYNSGIKSGVEGTPTFYINGRQYSGNWMSHQFIEDLKSFI